MGIFGTDTKWLTNEYTFDNVDANKFRNSRLSTLLNYLFMLLGIALKIIGMAADIYTLVTFGLKGESENASKLAYIPAVAYSAVFIGCIGISFIILIFRWIQGYKIYQTGQIALSYFYAVPRNFFSLKKFSYFCVFNEVSSGSFFNWFTFLTYFALKDWLNLLVADSPRQLLNGYTIFTTITNNRSTSNIIAVIKAIATEDVRQAVILSLMTLSFVIWLIFIVRFIICLCCVLPLRSEIHKLGFSHGLKAFCCVTINSEVASMVKRKNSELLLSDIRLANNRFDNGVAGSSRMTSNADTDLEKGSTLFTSNYIEKSDPFDVFVSATPRRKSSETDSLNHMLSSFPLPPGKSNTFSSSERPDYILPPPPPTKSTAPVAHDFQSHNPFDEDNKSPLIPQGDTESLEAPKMNPIYRTYDGSDPFSNGSDPFLDQQNPEYLANDFVVKKSYTDTYVNNKGVQTLPSLPAAYGEANLTNEDLHLPEIKAPVSPPRLRTEQPYLPHEMNQLYGTSTEVPHKRVRRYNTDPTQSGPPRGYL
ncbi:unnamed protein product [Kuraishia capsulata CBS 1993]|uniref:Vacuolar membrane protein n=1 Tax=Kuraishia capsulata CBS 1993 TaxID=1382522 RepID=W6MPJ6_9ASCO|nr:uncharacterized protein KUCA_T00003019001 [Kuraishia capsulata CBS 1993]CDK27042.1 unnamed protein product [Kuraishia capsulata CBS 1993]